MRTYPDLRMRAIHEAFGEAVQAADEQRYDEALSRFTKLRSTLTSLGITSAHLLHDLAIAADNLGRLEEAFQLMIDSLRIDPLAPNAQHSFDVIVRRIRLYLRDAVASDESIPRLHALLTRTAEADVDAHLSMARHLVFRGELEKAEALLSAVTLTAPASRDAWLAAANVARLRGDPLKAAELEAQAAAQALVDVPYGVRDPDPN